MDLENSSAAEAAPRAPVGAQTAQTAPAASASGSAPADPFYIPPPEVPTQEGPRGIRYDFNDGARVLLPPGAWHVQIEDDEKSSPAAFGTRGTNARQPVSSSSCRPARRRGSPGRLAPPCSGPARGGRTQSLRDAILGEGRSAPLRPLRGRAEPAFARGLPRKCFSA